MISVNEQVARALGWIATSDPRGHTLYQSPHGLEMYPEDLPRFTTNPGVLLGAFEDLGLHPALSLTLDRGWAAMLFEQKNHLDRSYAATPAMALAFLAYKKEPLS